MRAVERVLRLPSESTKRFVEEPDGAGSGEKEAAELLREDLFGRMERPWTDVVREGCLAAFEGVRFPEIVLEEREGRVAVKDIASRNPELLERWQYDESGKLVGYMALDVSCGDCGRRKMPRSRCPTGGAWSGSRAGAT